MAAMKKYFRTLTIAGSDSGGGAGIQADLKTFSALGCYGMSAITALTAQNTQGVQGIHGVPAPFVGKQIDAVIQDIGVDAVKIGMLHAPDIIKIVADRLQKYELNRVVLDPVMVAQSGDKLIQDKAIAALKEHLIPMATVVTPNLPEGAELLGRTIENADEIEEAAGELLALGCQSVLLKGGHFKVAKSSDCLAISKNEAQDPVIHWYEADRIDTRNNHGTGCTLSSAIACGLARGMDLPEAVEFAKSYITGAIKAGSQYDVGHGNGPLHHFYQLWNTNL